MRTMIFRKRIANFTNKQFDEFLQRVVKASGSLKNAAFTKLVSQLSNSAKKFHDLRMVLPASAYTEKINEIGRQADEIFRKIKMTVDYNTLCLSGKEQEAAKKFQSVIAFYGYIPQDGIVKKFVNYDSLVSELNSDTNAVTVLNLKTQLTKLADLTKEYRENILLRDNYRSGIKGKRKEARIAALKDFTNLRDSIEAFAVLNTETEVSQFSNLINEAFINVSPNSKKKES